MLNLSKKIEPFNTRYTTSDASQALIRTNQPKLFHINNSYKISEMKNHNMLKENV
jgi:hypothetical protein